MYRARVGRVRSAAATGALPGHRPGVRAVPYAHPPPPARAAMPSRGSGPTKAQIRADFLGPLFGYTGRHKLRGEKCRGKRWHKKGYRSYGAMWINIKRGRVSTRGADFREAMTLADFVREVQSKFLSSRCAACSHPRTTCSHPRTTTCRGLFSRWADHHTWRSVW